MAPRNGRPRSQLPADPWDPKKRQIPPPTSLERALYQALERAQVPYTDQKWVGRYRCDAYLPEFNCVVEIDGDFYHQLPAQRQKDKRKDAFYQAHGYRVARVWGSHFMRDADGWVTRLMRRLREERDDPDAL